MLNDFGFLFMVFYKTSNDLFIGLVGFPELVEDGEIE